LLGVSIHTRTYLKSFHIFLKVDVTDFDICSSKFA
jgi:hypothetical protein